MADDALTAVAERLYDLALVLYRLRHFDVCKDSPDDLGEVYARVYRDGGFTSVRWEMGAEAERIIGLVEQSRQQRRDEAAAADRVRAATAPRREAPVHQSPRWTGD